MLFPSVDSIAGIPELANGAGDTRIEIGLHVHGHPADAADVPDAALPICQIDTRIRNLIPELLRADPVEGARTLRGFGDGRGRNRAPDTLQRLGHVAQPPSCRPVGWRSRSHRQ